MTHRSDSRPRSSNGEQKKELWSTMLDEVSSGKRLPEKTLLVLGGTTETQRDFLEALQRDPNNRRRPPERSQRKKPPVANEFALGYTYQDVLDADQDDILARLSLYLLTDSSPSFAPLLRRLFTTKTLPDLAVTILLDWNEPWTWMRQLRQWVRILRSILISLDDECKDALEENIGKLRDSGRGSTADGSGSGADMGDLPLGPGEWDEPLGVPLCVVCQNADKIESLEKEKGWGEEELDFVLQYLRTILLKHGSSLIYTMPSTPGSLQPLIHSILGIQSPLKRQPLKHNVIDRDKVLVPPNWDSWGKIRVLREGFDVEDKSTKWSIEIQHPPDDSTSPTTAQTGAEKGMGQADGSDAVIAYEETIRDPQKGSTLAAGMGERETNHVESMDTQSFLAEQAARLDKFKADEEKEKASSGTKRGPLGSHSSNSEGALDDRGRGINDHIGPVQFNMGGIQVDADDMLKRLKVSEPFRPLYGLVKCSCFCIESRCICYPRKGTGN
jgi:dynein light intermediate chain 1, cytosolic